MLNEIVIKNLHPNVDYLRSAFKLHLRNTYPFRSRSKLFLGLTLFVISILFIKFSVDDKELEVWAFISFLYSMYLLYSYYTLTNRLAISFLKDFDNRFEQNSYKINKDGFIENLPFKNTEYKWEHFQKAIITKDLILLYESPIVFRIFSQKNYSVEDFKAIKSWIRMKITVIKESS